MAQARPVRLVDVPVGLFRRTQQYTDDLLREVALMVDDADGLVLEAAAHLDRSAAVRHAAALQVVAAEQDGRDAVTVELVLPAAGVGEIESWGRLMARLAALAREGRTLVVPPDDDVLRFQAWYVDEIVRQLRDGAAPRPWCG